LERYDKTIALIINAKLKHPQDVTHAVIIQQHMIINDLNETVPIYFIFEKNFDNLSCRSCNYDGKICLSHNFDKHTNFDTTYI
jgi:hypothetical protein